MSDLGKTSIIGIGEDYCIMKFEQYINDVSNSLNEQLREDNKVLKATVLALLMDLSIYYTRYKNNDIALAYIGGEKDKGIQATAYYSVDEADEIISDCSIIEWKLDAPDLLNKDISEKFNKLIKEYKVAEATYLLSTTYFVAKIKFKDPKWISGIVEGMTESTSLDTWICDWM